MNETSRYVSGSSLDRTYKEERLDSLERDMQIEWTDKEYAELKRMSTKAIALIHHALKERVKVVNSEEER